MRAVSLLIWTRHAFSQRDNDVLIKGIVSLRVRQGCPDALSAVEALWKVVSILVGTMQLSGIAKSDLTEQEESHIIGEVVASVGR